VLSLRSLAFMMGTTIFDRNMIDFPMLRISPLSIRTPCKYINSIVVFLELRRCVYYFVCRRLLSTLAPGDALDGLADEYATAALACDE
jgi:hypothetical protein